MDRLYLDEQTGGRLMAVIFLPTNVEEIEEQFSMPLQEALEHPEIGRKTRTLIEGMGVREVLFLLKDVLWYNPAKAGEYLNELKNAMA